MNIEQILHQKERLDDFRTERRLKRKGLKSQVWLLCVKCKRQFWANKKSKCIRFSTCPSCLKGINI